MKSAAKIWSEENQILVSPIGSDHCLLESNGQRIVLTYDVAYEMALKLSAWIQQAEELESQQETLLN